MHTEGQAPLLHVTLKYTSPLQEECMKFMKWMIAGALGAFLVSANPAITRAQDNGNGHGKGHNKHDRDDDDEHSEHYYKHHEEEAVRGWYSENERHLPPGLAKKDQLPPGLEKQLVRRGELPPGLQKRVQPCPEELQRRLPPPPPDCVNVLIGGHVVLLNHRTNVVVDVFHFEVN
jgi:hypothetical protein